VGFLAWIEASALADWVRMSTPGYPSMITLHAFGMAVMVGLCLILNLRLLGKFDAIPVASLQKFLGIAWIGFGINLLSGSALFSAQATSYIVDPVFMSKMALVFAGAAMAAILQPQLAKAASWPNGHAPSGVRTVALLSIVFWLTAITLGRLTAYL
jgi:hypothetical protein